MKTVPLGGLKAAGRVALVDDEDYELVSRYSWHIHVINKRGTRYGPYVRANLPAGSKPTSILMHTLITGWPQTDHIDHDGLNNQRSNLRPATDSQNGGNRRPTIGFSSPYKGVSWHKKNMRWSANIGFGGRQHYLGSFTSEEEAARAYDTAAREAWGEYAHLNFPDVPVNSV